MKALYGSVEGGGTKFVCLVGSGPQDVRAEIRFPTTTPAETIPQALDFFRQYTLKAVGIASFGPLDLDPNSPAHGAITTTPKPGWSGTNLLTALRSGLAIPVVIDVDVNAAAYGEYHLVAENAGLTALVYFTIGTGIGAGIVLNGQIVHGRSHPEVGHIRLPHDHAMDPFPGSCPYHGDCFEGLASGTALSARWGQPGSALPPQHPAWALESSYIAAALVNMILTVSPQRIILGGGVMENEFLFPLIRQNVTTLLHGYLSDPLLRGDLEAFITPPALGNRSGVLGALAMAKNAVEVSK
jgi:fructokinase